MLKYSEGLVGSLATVCVLTLTQNLQIKNLSPMFVLLWNRAFGRHVGHEKRTLMIRVCTL